MTYNHKSSARPHLKKAYLYLIPTSCLILLISVSVLLQRSNASAYESAANSYQDSYELNDLETDVPAPDSHHTHDDNHASHEEDSDAIVPHQHDYYTSHSHGAGEDADPSCQVLGWTWGRGDDKPKIATVAEASLANLDIQTTVEAFTFGERSNCGGFHEHGVDFVVSLDTDEGDIDLVAEDVHRTLRNEFAEIIGNVKVISPDDTFVSYVGGVRTTPATSETREVESISDQLFPVGLSGATASSAAAQVDSTLQWQSTGVLVEPSDTIIINVESGTWTHTQGVEPYNNGTGGTYVCGHAGCVEPLPSAPQGALIGKIGTYIFEIGAGTSVISPQAGELMVRMNDGDVGLYDNDGILTLDISGGSEPYEDSATVYADQQWQASSITVNANAPVEIAVTSGTWTHWENVVDLNPGTGGGYTCPVSSGSCAEPLPGTPTGALIGRIGSYVFEIGEGTTLIAPVSGELYFRINDADNGLFDNAGSLTVGVNDGDGQTAFGVDATLGWQATGATAEVGETVSVRVTSGAWTHHDGIVPPNPGTGATYTCYASYCQEPLRGTVGVLIGRIGSQIFEIGQAGSIVTAEAGELYVRINDADNGLDDNDGVLTLEISNETIEIVQETKGIDAQKGWQSLGINVRENETVNLSVVSGTWTHQDGVVPANAGTGGGYICGQNSCIEPLPQAPTGMLVGRIGTRIFEVGEGTSFVSPQTGKLYLRINDGDLGLFDNAGTLTVEADVERPDSEVGRTVDSQLGWQDMQVSVPANAEITIEVTAGLWTHDKDSVAPNDGVGGNQICVSSNSCTEPLAGVSTGKLIGRIGTHVFAIGNGVTLTSPQSGQLQVRINDADASLGDNEGSLTLNITVPPENSASAVRKVYVIAYNPILSNGKSLAEHAGWSDHATLTEGTIEFFKEVSNGQLIYEVAATTIVDDKWPMKADGFRYSESEYLTVLGDHTLAHDPDLVSYINIINDADFDICGRANRGEIDEVWIYNGPYFGFYESTLVGPNGYWFNSWPVAGSHDCERLIPIMGPSQERDLDSALHNFGHRMESSMSQAYGYIDGIWDSTSTADGWVSYSLLNFRAPAYDYSGCGDIHHPPNTSVDYDYNNSIAANTNCDDFFNYPDLGDPVDTVYQVTCDAWSCTQIGYLNYWFSRLPATDDCDKDDVYNNWWAYFIEPDLANTPDKPCDSYSELDFLSEDSATITFNPFRYQLNYSMMPYGNSYATVNQGGRHTLSDSQDAPSYWQIADEDGDLVKQFGIFPIPLEAGE